MPFQPGKLKTGGRQVGTPNRITAAFKEAVVIVYDELGGHDAFTAWAKENPTEFYKICARLIPGEMRDGGQDRNITVVISRERAPTLDDRTSRAKLEGPSAP